MKPTYEQLEEQINKNSKNRSKPPSSDQKPNTTDPNMKKRKGRKGVNRKLAPPERVDQHVQCSLKNCPHCGSPDLKLRDVVEILQQVEF